MILHVIARLNLGGTSVWIRNLVNGFELYGIQSTVITGSVDSEPEDVFADDPRVIKLEKWKRKSFVIDNLSALLKIRKLIKSIKPKVINTHTSKAGIIGRIAALSLCSNRPRVIHTIHGHYLYGYSRPIISKAWLLNEAILSLFSTKVICVGSQVRDDLVKSRIFQKSKLVTILPGLENVLERSSATLFDTELDLVDTFTVGWMGRLEEVKNPELVLSIAKFLPSINFIMVGAGSLSKRIKQMLPINLKLFEFMEPQVLWETCHAALSTSNNEGVPTALIEANYFKCPIIAPDVGSIKDVVVTGVNGILLENKEIEDYCGAIIKLRDDKKVYQDMKQGCIVLSPKFDIVKMISEHSLVYEITRFMNK